MSAYSTLRITRSKAKEYIVAKVLSELSDEELSDVMDKFLYDRLYNCVIVADDSEENDNFVI